MRGDGVRILLAFLLLRFSLVLVGCDFSGELICEGINHIAVKADAPGILTGGCSTFDFFAAGERAELCCEDGFC